MEPKPTELLLAVMQFLEILVPGALVAYFAQGFANHYLFRPGGPLPAVRNEAEGWAVFFVASYVLGHFVFLLSSLLDDWFYDPLRDRLKPKEKDHTYNRANEIRIRHIGDPKSEVVNAFKWSKALLNLQASGSMIELRRHESDSKFFRSLAVVFAFLP